MTETFTTFLVGNNFRSIDEQSFLLDLPIGSEVVLVRDHDNPYDANAIKVMDSEGVLHLGLVAAKNAPNVASEIAPLIDEGVEFVATIVGGGTAKKPALQLQRVDEED